MDRNNKYEVTTHPVAWTDDVEDGRRAGHELSCNHATDVRVITDDYG